MIRLKSSVISHVVHHFRQAPSARDMQSADDDESGVEGRVAIAQVTVERIKLTRLNRTLFRG